MQTLVSKIARAAQDEGLSKILYIPPSKRGDHYRVLCLPELIQGLVRLQHRNDQTSYIWLFYNLFAMLPPCIPKLDNLPLGKVLALEHLH